MSRAGLVLSASHHAGSNLAPLYSAVDSIGPLSLPRRRHDRRQKRKKEPYVCGAHVHIKTARGGVRKRGACGTERRSVICKYVGHTRLTWERESLRFEFGGSVEVLVYVGLSLSLEDLLMGCVVCVIITTRDVIVKAERWCPIQLPFSGLVRQIPRAIRATWTEPWPMTAVLSH
jgi:hypothetical protein